MAGESVANITFIRPSVISTAAPCRVEVHVNVNADGDQKMDLVRRENGQEWIMKEVKNKSEIIKWGFTELYLYWCSCWAFNLTPRISTDKTLSFYDWHLSCLNFIVVSSPQLWSYWVCMVSTLQDGYRLRRTWPDWFFYTIQRGDSFESYCLCCLCSAISNKRCKCLQYTVLSFC